MVDEHGNPVPGIEVAFAPAAGSGVTLPAVSTTDASGFATTAWTLGWMLGTQTVTATVAGVPPVTFTATGTGNPYDGTYQGTRVWTYEGHSGYCTVNVPVAMQVVFRDGEAINYDSGGVDRDGVASFIASGGINYNRYSGTFVLDGTGGSSGTGTIVYPDKGCDGTWSVTRQ